MASIIFHSLCFLLYGFLNVYIFTGNLQLVGMQLTSTVSLISVFAHRPTRHKGCRYLTTPTCIYFLHYLQFDGIVYKAAFLVLLPNGLSRLSCLPVDEAHLFAYHVGLDCSLISQLLWMILEPEFALKILLTFRGEVIC